MFESDLSSTEEPSEPKLIDYHEEAVTCLSTSVRLFDLLRATRSNLTRLVPSLQNEFFASGNESGVVALHKNGSNEFVELVTRCSFPVRSARFDPKGKRIAVASE